MPEIKKKNVLIVSKSSDVHSDDLVRACQRQGVDCFRLNTDHFRLEGEVTYDVSVGGVLKYAGRACKLSDVDLLIYRRPEYAHRKRKDIEPWLGAFLDKEWETVEQAISTFVRGKVMNPIAAAALADNKIAQLELAKKFGLNIPETRISSNKAELVNFIKEGDVVTKGIHNSGYLYSGTVHPGRTVKVNAQDIEGIELRGAITLVQKAINASAVWRVVTVGEKSFGFRMSGAALKKNIDSRFFQGEMECEHLPVPEETKTALKTMCHSIGILYASSDFIEDESGKLWFIDLNPEGEWGYFELKTGIPISDEIIGLALL